MHATDDLKIGKLYRLGFPGIAARVIEPPAGMERSSKYCYLVRELQSEKSLVGQPARGAGQHLLPTIDRTDL